MWGGAGRGGARRSEEEEGEEEEDEEEEEEEERKNISRHGDKATGAGTAARGDHLGGETYKAKQ